MEEKELLEKANVLVISDIEDDYEGLIKYGFQNVDYFKSIVRAEHYFESHENELEKYHIVFMGHQWITEDFDHFEQKLRDLAYQKKSLFIPISRYEYEEHREYNAYLPSFGRLEETSYSELIQGIVYFALEKNILETAIVTSNVYPKIQDYINPNKLPFPKKKEDIKILFLESSSVVSEATPKIFQNLGLNVEIRRDNNYGIERNVRESLGEYDIVMATRLFSSKLAFLDQESTEQCKDTGRKLTLLLTYDNQAIYHCNEEGKNDSFGDKILLNYVFGGELASNLKNGTKKYCAIRSEDARVYGVETTSDYLNSLLTCMKCSLEEAVHIYNEALKELGEPTLENLDFKTEEEYNQEYIAFENEHDQEKERRKKEREEALKPIRAFDNLERKVRNYLLYKEKHLVPSYLKDLRITASDSGVLVEILVNNQVFGALCFSYNRRDDNLRVFDIRTQNNKGTKLSNFETVGVYTKYNEDREGIPKRLNESQEKTFMAICKRVDFVLTPINEEAKSKYLEAKDFNHLVRKLRKKKRYY